MKTSPFLGWWPSSPCADTKVFTAAWWCGDLGAAWNHGATCWHHKGVHFRSATVEVPKGGQFQPFDSKPLDSLCCTFEKTPFDTLRCPSSYPPYFLPHSIQCLKVEKQSQDKAQLPCSRIESKFLQKVFGKGGGCLNRSGFSHCFEVILEINSDQRLSAQLLETTWQQNQLQCESDLTKLKDWASRFSMFTSKQVTRPLIKKTCWILICWIWLAQYR